MGYDLKPKNADAGYFHFGAFSFPVLMEACGYLFPCINRGCQFYCASGVDPRMPEGDTYPRLLSNDGFAVTDEEAKIMARVARNFVAIQRTLPEENRSTGLIDKGSMTKGDVMQALTDAMHGEKTSGPWPLKIRDDFTQKFAEFAEWAEKSGGFEIH